MSKAIPITLVDKDGNEHDFLFQYLVEDTIETLDNWVRKRHIQLVRNSLTDDEGNINVPEKTYQTEMTMAQHQASTMTWVSPVGAKLLATVEGMSMLSWLSLRANHPEMKRTDMYKFMGIASNIREVTQAVNESRQLAPFLGARPPKAGKKQKKRDRSKQRSKRKKPQRRRRTKRK